MELITELLSGLLDMAATFDCFININKKMQYCNKTIWFYLVLGVSTCYSSLYYIWWLYARKITEVSEGHYAVETTEFAGTQAVKYLRIFHILVRKLFVLVDICVINIAILMTMRMATARKRALARTANNTERTGLVRSESAERRKIIMIVLNGLNYGIVNFLIYLR